MAKVNVKVTEVKGQIYQKLPNFTYIVQRDPWKYTGVLKMALGSGNEVCDCVIWVCAHTRRAQVRYIAKQRTV